MRSVAARIQPVPSNIEKPVFSLVEEAEVFVVAKQQQQDDRYPAYTKTAAYKAEMIRQQQLG